MKCPHCKKDVDEKKLVFRHSRIGRETTCPECGDVFFLYRRLENPARNRPKHLSKKERIKARRQNSASPAPHGDGKKSEEEV